MNGQIDIDKLQMVLNYLDKIAAKLNIGVQGIWPWFVKQQYVDAYVSLGFLIATIIVASICLCLTLKLWRKEDKYSKRHLYNNQNGIKEKIYAYSIYYQNHELGWLWANVICIAAVLFSAFVFCVRFFAIFNPEYYAFKDIIGMLPLN